jgi:hypothetical protein
VIVSFGCGFGLGLFDSKPMLNRKVMTARRIALHPLRRQWDRTANQTGCWHFPSLGLTQVVKEQVGEPVRCAIGTPLTLTNLASNRRSWEGEFPYPAAIQQNDALQVGETAWNRME